MVPDDPAILALLEKIRASLRGHSGRVTGNAEIMLRAGIISHLAVFPRTPPTPSDAAAKSGYCCTGDELETRYALQYAGSRRCTCLQGLR
jgi:hypothetical protein